MRRHGDGSGCDEIQVAVIHETGGDGLGPWCPIKFSLEDHKVTVLSVWTGHWVKCSLIVHSVDSCEAHTISLLPDIYVHIICGLGGIKSRTFSTTGVNLTTVPL